MENRVSSAGRVQHWNQKSKSLREEALQFFLLVYLFFFLWELFMHMNSLCIVKSLISQRPPGTNLKSDRIRCIDLMQQRRALQRSSEKPHKREQESIF